MSIKVKDKDKLADVSLIRVKEDGKLKNVTIIKMMKNGVWYTIWELIVAFIFTRDGFGLQTRDGYIIKCRDQ